MSRSVKSRYPSVKRLSITSNLRSFHRRKYVTRFRGNILCLNVKEDKIRLIGKLINSLPHVSFRGIITGCFLGLVVLYSGGQW